MKNYLDFHLTEIVSALGVFTWGVLLLNPFTDVFVLFANSYQTMASHASENEWGLIAALFGLMSLLGLYYKNKTVRVIGMSSVMAWRVFQMLFIGLQTSFKGPGFGDFILWVLLAFHALYKINHES